MNEKEFNELMEKINQGIESSLKQSAESGLLSEKFIKEDQLKAVVSETIKTEMEATTAGLVTVDQFAEKLEAVGFKPETVKELSDAVQKQGLEIQKMLNKGKNVSEDPVKDALLENKERIMNVPKEGGFKLKIAGAGVNKTLLQTSAVSGSTVAQRLTEIGQLPYLEPVIANLFRTVQGNFPGGVIRYIDQANITRSASTVSEGAQKPESAIDWIERTLPIEKIADSIPVSKEAWNDFDFVESEVRRLLDVNLTLEEDQQFWNGTGVAPQIDGVFTQASEFVPTAYIGTTTEDNIYDLIAFLKVDIMNSKQSKYMPNIAVMNPVDTLRYKLAKASNGHYILPPFITADGRTVDGVLVIESSQVTANTMLVGDFRYGTRYLMEDVTVEMGYVNDQFIKNTFTILAEKREALLIRNVDVDAFRKVSDITSALNTLLPSV